MTHHHATAVAIAVAVLLAPLTACGEEEEGDCDSAPKAPVSLATDTPAQAVPAAVPDHPGPGGPSKPRSRHSSTDDDCDDD